MQSKRKFGEIARLMRSHRQVPGGLRGVRFNNAAPAGGGGASAGEAALVELVNPIDFSDPRKATQEGLERARLAAIELDKRDRLRGEGMVQITSQLADIRKIAEEAREGMRNALRTVPPADASDTPFASLKHVQLSRHVEGERDKDFAAFNRLEQRGADGVGQYNLLVRSADELGITGEREKLALRRLKVLHNATIYMMLARGRDPMFKVTELSWWNELQSLGRKFLGALADANTGEGKEWVQVNLLASTIEERIELELEFSKVFGTFPMRAASVKWPVFAEHGDGYRVVENLTNTGDTADGTIPISSWETSEATFSAEKFAAAVVMSSEWEEDAIEGSQRAEERLAFRLARVRENAIVNGQSSGAIDGGTIAASNVRSLWDGVRKFFALTGKTARDLGAGITAEELAAIFGAQGASGAKPREACWLTGTAGGARLLVAKFSDGSPVMITQAPGATNYQTGQVGLVFGRPVYLSEFVSEKMQADGTIDDVATPTGDKTAIYHVHHRAMKIGQRRGVIASRSDERRFLEDQVMFKATAREDFQPLFTPSATKVLVMAGVNISTF